MLKTRNSTIEDLKVGTLIQYLSGIFLRGDYNINKFNSDDALLIIKITVQSLNDHYVHRGKVELNEEYHVSYITKFGILTSSYTKQLIQNSESEWNKIKVIC